MFKAGMQVAHRSAGQTVNTGTVSKVDPDGTVCVTWHKPPQLDLRIPRERLRLRYAPAAAEHFIYPANGKAES